MLLKMVEARGSHLNPDFSESVNNGLDLSSQVLALRLLATILPHSAITDGQKTQIQERLFKLLGHTALMCR